MRPGAQHSDTTFKLGKRKISDGDLPILKRTMTVRSLFLGCGTPPFPMLATIP